MTGANGCCGPWPATRRPCRSCTAQAESRLPELELEWLAGYEGSKPVRTGNAAVTQFQLDVYGEVMDASTRPDSWTSRPTLGLGPAAGPAGL